MASPIRYRERYRQSPCDTDSVGAERWKATAIRAPETNYADAYAVLASSFAVPFQEFGENGQESYILKVPANFTLLISLFLRKEHNAAPVSESARASRGAT
jgi:hypothetical protein